MDEENRRPGFLRPTDGRSGTPLLYKDRADDDRGRAGFSSTARRGSRQPSPEVLHTTLVSQQHTPEPMSAPPTFSRRSTMRSRSPGTAARAAARKKYTYATIFLLVSLVSFTAQTELAAAVQRRGWAKAYAMLYLTHGSWVFLWPAQLAVLRLRARDVPWPVFWRRHVALLRTTAQMVWRGRRGGGGASAASSPVPYMLRTTAFVTSALTVAGLSWYVAVSMTSPSDLTAIYNCSAFFAYAFSVPLLRERLRADKAVAVAVAIVGVLVVAYGDAKPPRAPHGAAPGAGDGADGAEEPGAGTRFLGNLIIGAGSVLYGLYEVLYKRYACPPEGTGATRGMVFANLFGSLIGGFTLTVLWLPLPLLHWLGWETFSLPTGETAWLLFLSVVFNATFAGSFLVLISLTSPVLSSVASLLTIFIVALSDWWLTGDPPSFAALAGGCMIVLAFLMLSWSTYREMMEDEKRKSVDYDEDDSDVDSRDSDESD